jgi:hypothetical protein
VVFLPIDTFTFVLSLTHTVEATNNRFDLNTVATMRRTGTSRATSKVPLELRKLTCGSGRGGRMEFGTDSTWNLSPCQPASDYEVSDEDNDDDSLASDGSRITTTTLDPSTPTSSLNVTIDAAVVTPEMPASPLASRAVLDETPPEKRGPHRKLPDDCHVIIRWSELSNLIKHNMVCSGCGNTIINFDRRTVGIATEIDFSCKCRETYTAFADRSDYMLEQSEKTGLIRRERRIDNYELNWRLLMATQLMGESQIGGSIIGLFLDLTREAFRNAWSPMEDALGVQQRKIGQDVVDFNLNQETMGKEAFMCDDGKLRYPVSSSYDMGWQKSKKTYDSMSGHGLLIGSQTKRVICFQNYSKSCGKCERHKSNILNKRIPDVPVAAHNCPWNHDGSSKGMEAKAALECINKVWSHETIRAFITVVCIDDDASTKAFLSHSFENLDAKGLPRPTNSKGEPKTLARDNKGQLPKDHPVMTFLADLCHRVRSFAKYLYALKPLSKKKSEMNDIDCLRLKRNYAWWIFTGASLTYEEFKNSALSPVLHHFNDHSRCGSWCHHKNKDESELANLKKYRCKKANNKLYLQCMEIIEKFTTEARLRECHHLMNSQKNEAMNKSIMRYVPKDKTYARTMALTSRLNLAISIDSLGHATYYTRLFGAMKFRKTELTFSGLRRMWRKKEYGRMYHARRRVKKRRRINQREKMIDGIIKMETDATAGMTYSSAMVLEQDEGENDDKCEEPARKRAKTNNNQRTSVTGKKEATSCKCGGDDHRRITSSKCPWKGLSQKVVCENYERRLKENKMDANIQSLDANGQSTQNVQQVPAKEMRSDAKDPVKCTPISVEMSTHEKVQYTSKFWRQPTIRICDMRTHVTHLVRLLR